MNENTARDWYFSLPKNANHEVDMEMIIEKFLERPAGLEKSAYGLDHRGYTQVRQGSCALSIAMIPPNGPVQLKHYLDIHSRPLPRLQPRPPLDQHHQLPPSPFPLPPSPFPSSRPLYDDRRKRGRRTSETRTAS
jgi:hypothetical protein